MSTINWPASLQPRDFRASVEYNQIAASSPLTKTTTVIDYLGERWRFGFTLPPIVNKAQAAYREALLLSLRGKSNKVNLWHMARPLPLGTMRGTPVLASTAAQGAQSLVLSGAWDTSRQNIFPYSDAITNWRSYAQGVTYDRISIPNTPQGVGYGSLVVESAALDDHLIDRYQPYTAGPGIYTFSAYLYPRQRRVMMQVYANGGAVSQFAQFDVVNGVLLYKTPGCTAQISSAPNGWWRCSVTCDVTSTPGPLQRIQLLDATGASYYSGDGVSGVWVWGLQLEPGQLTDYIPTTTTGRYASGTVKAGDMLGVGGMLVMAADDALADASGNMTVSLCNRLRKSVSSGSAVTWDKPTSTFILADGYGPVSYSPGIAESMSLDFVESW